MITQIKSPSIRRNEEKSLTLDVHPELKVKLRTRKLSTSHLDNSSKPEKMKLSGSTRCQNNYLNTINSTFFGESKVDSPARKTLYKPLRMSSYQMYKQEQKQNKFIHKEKVTDWKNKLWNRKTQDSRAMTREYMRSKSENVTGNINKITPMPNKLIQTITNYKFNKPEQEDIESPRSRSLYIKTHDGKRRLIDNRKYLQRLKQCLEVSHLSSTYQGVGTQTLEPQVLALSPKHKSNSRSPLNKWKDPLKTSNLKSQLQLKRNKRMMKNRFNFEGNDSMVCRPWSGLNNEFNNNDFQNFLM